MKTDLRFFITTLAGILLSISSLHSQILSKKAEISLLTGSPGDELYSTFGHSAIRIRDPETTLDLVYNYGTFNFNTPNFYIKFLRGKLDYMLSIQRFSNFKRGFIYENRSINELILDLDSAEKQQVFDFLKNNYLPENRYYHYDFFFDNCATRIRDLFQTVLGERLQYHYPDEWSEHPMTFRQLLDVCLVRQPWSDFGIDIIIGLPADRRATPSQYLFLPVFMEQAFKLATLTDRQGNPKPLVKMEREILPLQFERPPVTGIFPMGASWIFLTVIILLTTLGYYLRVPLVTIDAVVFTGVGLIGWLIVFLWFFTEHQATKDNLNILWALPLHIPFIYFILNKHPHKIWHIWLGLSILLITIVLFFWWGLSQQLHPALIPLLLALELRLLVLLITRYVNPTPPEKIEAKLAAK
jgi:hypothetical protein